MPDEYKFDINAVLDIFRKNQEEQMLKTLSSVCADEKSRTIFEGFVRILMKYGIPFTTVLNIMFDINNLLNGDKYE